MSQKLLPIPYKSQKDGDAQGKNNDCGPACVSMILAARGVPNRIDEVYAASGVTTDRPLSILEIRKAAQAFGLTLSSRRPNTIEDLRAIIDQGIPPIALIKYKYLPDRQGQSTTGGHFVLVVGYDDEREEVIIHDPYYWPPRREEGAFHRYSESTWNEAWGRCHEDSNSDFWLVLPDLLVPLDLQMARRRVYSRLAYAGKSDYNGTPFDQLDDATITQLTASLGEWPAGVDEYTVEPGEGKRQIAFKVYGTWKRWSALQYYNELSEDTEPAAGTVLQVPRPVAYVQSTVTRWGGLKVRTERAEGAQVIERLPANTRIVLLSVNLTEDGQPWTDEAGDVWVRVRSPFDKEGWARYRYAKDNEIYLADKPGVLQKPVWGAGKCLAGLGTADPWPLIDKDYGVIDTAHLELIKLMAPSKEAQGQGADIAKRLIGEGKFVMARLFEKPGNRRMSAAEFADSVMQGYEALYQAGVRYFEIHNEPNLPQEGLGVSWANGGEFGNWFIAVCSTLKARHADAKLGYPGLSPQFNNPSFPAEADIWTFLEASEAAVQRADWIGVHCYWQNEGSGHWAMQSEVDGLLWKKFRARWPHKLLFITEFSNNGRHIDYATKGEQYGRYYSLLRHEPNLGGAVAFALYWPGQDENHEGWRTDHGVTEIAQKVGEVTGQAEF
jgi:hypothetical protein